MLCCFLGLWIAKPVSASADPESLPAGSFAASVSPVSPPADPESINYLINHSSDYDSQTITITGEVIGERMVRGDGCWINMSDGTNAIGIWISKSDSDLLRVFGDYKHTGDTVTITGVYYESCREHGGEPDVHGSSLIVSKTGVERQETVSVEKILSAVSIVSAALILFIIYTSKNRIRTAAISHPA